MRLFGVVTGKDADYGQRHHPGLRIHNLQAGGADQAKRFAAAGIAIVTGLNAGGGVRQICHASQDNQSTPVQAMTRCRRGCVDSASPTPMPTVSTSSAAPPQPPRMIGNVAVTPLRALWLRTMTFVGPGVIDATTANIRKGRKGRVSGMRPLLRPQGLCVWKI